VIVETLKKYFVGDTLSGTLVKYRGRNALFVDFAEIRVIGKYVDEELVKDFDCKVKHLSGVTVITPKLVDKYKVLCSKDEKLKEELGKWFDENFLELARVVLARNDSK